MSKRSLAFHGMVAAFAIVGSITQNDFVDTVMALVAPQKTVECVALAGKCMVVQEG